MTDAFERLKAALADRYAIERELGWRPETISDGQGPCRTVKDDPESSESLTVSS